VVIAGVTHVWPGKVLKDKTVNGTKGNGGGPTGGRIYQEAPEKAKMRGVLLEVRQDIKWGGIQRTRNGGDGGSIKKKKKVGKSGVNKVPEKEKKLLKLGWPLKVFEKPL